MEETTEELQRIKLEHDINLLRRKFYQRPEFLSIIFSSIFAAIAIFSSIYFSNSKELEELKIAKQALDNQVYEINNQKLSEREESLKASIKALEEKEKNLNDSINFKYKKKLLSLEKDLKNIRDFYIRDYAVGYSNAALKSKRIKTRIALYVKENKVKNFEKWLYSELKRGIDISTQRTLDKIDFEMKINNFQSN